MPSTRWTRSTKKRRVTTTTIKTSETRNRVTRSNLEERKRIKSSKRLLVPAKWKQSWRNSRPRSKNCQTNKRNHHRKKVRKTKRRIRAMQPRRNPKSQTRATSCLTMTMGRRQRRRKRLQRKNKLKRQISRQWPGLLISLCSRTALAIRMCQTCPWATIPWWTSPTSKTKKV